MSDRLDDDLLDDLADEGEGPAQSRHAYDEGDDELAEFDEADDDALDDEGDEFEGDEADVADEMEDAVADALEAESAASRP